MEKLQKRHHQKGEGYYDGHKRLESRGRPGGKSAALQNNKKKRTKLGQGRDQQPLGQESFVTWGGGGGVATNRNRLYQQKITKEASLPARGSSEVRKRTKKSRPGPKKGRGILIMVHGQKKGFISLKKKLRGD